MNFEIFKTQLMERLQKLFKEVEPTVIIEDHKILKAQKGELTAITFRKPEMTAAPTLYAEDMYEFMNARHLSVDDVARDMMDNILPLLKTSSEPISPEEIVDVFDLEKHPENLSIRLLGKKGNLQLLDSLIFKDVCDGLVAIVDICHGDYRAVITREMLALTSMDEDAVFEQALKNGSFDDVVFTDLEACIGGADKADNYMFAHDIPFISNSAFVLTNRNMYWGASTILYPGVIAKIHRLIGKTFYILPSSVHELIIMSATDDVDPKAMIETIRSANRNVCAKEDILANDLYMCCNGQILRCSYDGKIPKCSSAENSQMVS